MRSESHGRRCGPWTSHSGREAERWVPARCEREKRSSGWRMAPVSVIRKEPDPGARGIEGIGVKAIELVARPEVKIAFEVFVAGCVKMETGRAVFPGWWANAPRESRNGHRSFAGGDFPEFAGITKKKTAGQRGQGHVFLCMMIA